MSQQTQINDVADTSIWVAYYRAKESERPDAMFRDPFARRLVGERGRQIADSMPTIGRYTEWSVVTRTVIIDDYIQELVRGGLVDTIVNLGAGLDARPYRMSLPAELNWIEVDYPRIIDYKEEILKGETPKCRLRRVSLDLADDQKRREFLAKTAAESNGALVITEGVIVYLTEEQVAKLADDLHSHPSIKYWITEYFHADVYPRLKSQLRTRMMQNAPFQFYPPDWLGFFASHGWKVRQARYSGEETLKRGRKLPFPWWAQLIMRLAPKEARNKPLRMTGFLLFERK